VARIPYTEAANPRTRGLDRKDTVTILRILNREDRHVPVAVGRVIPAIAQAVDLIVEALTRGGRLIYAGAGTSGRLGVLDAAECPPTFGVPPTTVQALLAGGRRAFDRALEGMEDSVAAGRRDAARVQVGRPDVVVGLTASGSTPYVRGVLQEARHRGAATVLITTNPDPTALWRLARVVIAVAVGPEPIAGSTRMKSGTAQKLVLNMLSTAAMVRLGRIYDHWMVYVTPGNQKLRRRAVRILEQIAATSPQTARRLLDAAGGRLPVAVVMALGGVSAARARNLLRHTHGHVRRAIELAQNPRQEAAHGRIPH